MRKLKHAAGAIVVLGGLSLFLYSSCGGDPPAAVADNNAGGGPGAEGGGAGTSATSGAAGSSAQDDASVVGSGGASTDMDATIFVDAPVPIPDGAFTTGDATLDDDGGNEPPLDDAGAPPSEGGVVGKSYTIFCGAKSCSGPLTDCCYDSDTATGTCSSVRTKCPTTTGTYECDEPADCDANEVCCASVSTLAVLLGSPNHEYQTRCAASCGTGAILRDTAYAVACKRAADCGLGQTCKAVVNMPKGVGVCGTSKIL